jgi:uncharacterized membrane protein
MSTISASPPSEVGPPRLRSVPRLLGRVALASFFGFAGLGHFFAREAFTAQVPPWVPFTDAVIYLSGIIEISFALALLFAPPHWRPRVGWLLAGFLVVIFPGNISQYLEQRDQFGLTSDSARLIRLFFQPVFVVWALWCTGAWAAYRERRAR